MHTSLSSRLPYLAGLLAAMLWAGNFVVGKYARIDFPPVTLSLLRWLIAFTVLTPFILSNITDKLKRLWCKKGTLLVLALTGISATNTFIYIGLGETSANNALLLNTLMPGFIAAMSLFTGRLNLNKQTIFSMAFLTIGILFLLSHHNGVNAGLAVGDVWVLAGVICWAVFSVLMQQLPKEVNPFFILWVLIGVGIVPLVPWSLWEMHHTTVLWHDVKPWLSVLYIGIGPSLLAMLAYHSAIKGVGACVAGQFLNLIPVFGTMLSALLLGEMVSGEQLLALVVILLAMLIAQSPWQWVVKGARRVVGQG